MNKKVIKAYFLLVVFFLNTLVGMACALTPRDCCHKHEAIASKHCCNDAVLKFQQLDKSLEQHFNTVMNTPVVFITLPSLQVVYNSYPLQYRIIRQEIPPDDIRVSIQSFQI
jgi:hypothetical protein